MTVESIEINNNVHMRVCKQIDYSAIFKIVLKMAEFPLTGYKLYCADVFARNTSLFCTIPTDFISGRLT